jgi:AbrB family looped-hinge helix DNA binding protein
MTTKGQVTIPLQIRQKIGLQPWTEVEFEVTPDGQGVTLRRKAGGQSRGDRLLAALRQSPRPKPGMSTNELMALTRGE